jgi:quercetin dioxygenase-like cupin family protein
MKRQNMFTGRGRFLRSAVIAGVIGAFLHTAGARADEHADVDAKKAAVASVLQKISRKDLQRHDLGIAGQEVIQTVVSLEPGVVAPWHRHPGEEIIYVLSGTLVYEVEGQPAKTLRAGDVLFVPAGVAHSVTNIGSDTGSELATYVVDKSKPLLSLAE